MVTHRSQHADVFIEFLTSGSNFVCQKSAKEDFTSSLNVTAPSPCQSSHPFEMLPGTSNQPLLLKFMTPHPHPRLKCLNTSPLHVLVVKVRWVHGLKKRDLKKNHTKKAADNSFPVSESVFHLTFSNKKEPFPMSFLKYARKKKKLARLS